MIQASAVFFDVGETLVDETAMWAAWADRLGVPRHTFSAVFGAVVAAGRDHRDVFRVLGLDPGGLPEPLVGPDDLYPDARPCLEALHARGFRIGVAGNQPAGAEAAVRALGLPAGVVATSAGWGVAKPAPGFYARLVEAAGRPAGEVVYAGDRLDNDVVPALAAGLSAVRVRRGPWAWLEPTPPPPGLVTIDGLAELPGLLSPRPDASGASRARSARP